MPSHRILIFEVNEISWELMREWLDGGELPHFERLQQEGTWGKTFTEEPPELLDPWVTWTTFYTGVPQSEHGMQFLEQPAETIRAKRLWELVHEGDKKVGVFGSVSSWPPRMVKGFFVPGSFSIDSQTYPEELQGIQDLNLRYTRAHVPGARQKTCLTMLSDAISMVEFGLDLRTAWAIAVRLVESKIWSGRNWKQVSLQPILNLRFFKKLYRRFRPDFATFHTNHVAHYQHRFFRAWRPEVFPDSSDPAEIQQYSKAIYFGYTVADKILGEFLKIAEQEHDLILCVASSMGQKPWIPSRYGNVAPVTCRIRSMERLVQVLGIAGKCEFFSTMAPQWNIQISDTGLRQKAIADLNAARYESLKKSMYATQEVKDTVVVTPISQPGLSRAELCRFPTLEGSPSYPIDELVMQVDETRKSGCHDPIGLVAFYGSSVRKNYNLGTVNILDVAPTILSFLNLPVPGYMSGKILLATS